MPRLFSGLLALLLLVSQLMLVPISFLENKTVSAQSSPVRRVNAPYNVPGYEAAVFWFGGVTPDQNYADVRVLYSDQHLVMHLNIMDRRLWYDTSPSADSLTEWDAVSLYIDPQPSVSSNSYRFDGQLVWYQNRAPYQAAFRREAGAWSLTSLPFETNSNWAGYVPNNNDGDDRGWSLTFRIPYTSLGLSGPPAQRTLWRMGVALHDRDDAGGASRSTQTWPDAMAPADSGTWGELVFGAPQPHTPPPTNPGGTLTVRHGLNGVQVMDADVGGSSTCGGQAAPDYFPGWGALNYVGKEILNIQNLGYISDWPCFSKYYVTFPIDALPPGKVILSAQLTLYQSGNAGEGETPGPQPSLIQVSTIDQHWSEASVTWNNAPQAVENIASSWVDTLDSIPPWPGIPREWDVSTAVAGAYATGNPVRLALYSPDWEWHSGKYFFSSDIGGGGEGRPTLTIQWGEPAPQLEKEADKGAANLNESVVYTLRFRGSGVPMTVTSRLPAGVQWEGNVQLQGTTVQPVYDPVQHQVTWQDSPPQGQAVRISYTVVVNTAARQALVNASELSDQQGSSSSVSVTVIANPQLRYQPLLTK